MILILAGAVSSATIPQQCYSELIYSQSCEWYLVCLQAEFKCGPSGYPQGYGFKYCTKFSQLKNKVVPTAQNWIQLTKVCLKESLLPSLDSLDKNCKRLKRQAFDTHPDCYKESGFCKLYKELGPIQSQKFMNQLLGVFDAKDFQSAQALQQILKLQKECLSSS